MKEFNGYKKGINIGGWLSQCIHTTEHYNSFINESDIEKIASWGLDHIRLPIDYVLVEKSCGEYSEEGFKYIDNCINWCKKNNINLIIDLHKTAGYSFDDLNQKENFFENKELQNRFILLWDQIAKRYSNHHNYLAFELLNEVVDEKYYEVWNNIANQAIKVIRKYSRDIKIIVGGVRNNSIQFMNLLDIEDTENIVYTFHFYEPTIFTHQSAHWVEKMPLNYNTTYPNSFSEYSLKTEMFFPNEYGYIYRDFKNSKVIDRSFIEKCIIDGVKLAEERNVPLYCGEYGVISLANYESTLNWYSDIHEIFEKFDISRAVWNYKGMDFGIIDSNDSNYCNELIKLL